eukprot:jgi/Chrzof1/13657/Cz08g07010.t1
MGNPYVYPLRHAEECRAFSGTIVVLTSYDPYKTNLIGRAPPLEDAQARNGGPTTFDLAKLLRFTPGRVGLLLRRYQNGHKKGKATTKLKNHWAISALPKALKINTERLRPHVRCTGVPPPTTVYTQGTLSLVVFYRAAALTPVIRGASLLHALRASYIFIYFCLLQDVEHTRLGRPGFGSCQRGRAEGPPQHW